MAIFPSATVGSIEKNDDIAKVNQYLRKLNDDLTYMFNNLTPDDNWSASAPKLIYSVDENGEASFEISSSGIRMRVASDEYVKSNVEILDNKISLKVSLGDVVNQVNSELLITGNSIALTTGHFTVNSTNLTVDSAGNATFSGALSAATGTFAGALSAATGTFAGALSGGTISIGGTAQAPAFAVDANGNLTANAGVFKGNLDGATIDGENGLHAGGKFYVEYWGSHTHDYDIGCGGFGFYEDENNHDVFSNAPYSEPIRFEVDANTGEVWCRDIYPYTNGSRWAHGVAWWIDWLYEQVTGGGGGGDGSESDSQEDGPIIDDLHSESEG